MGRRILDHSQKYLLGLLQICDQSNVTFAARLLPGRQIVLSIAPPGLVIAETVYAALSDKSDRLCYGTSSSRIELRDLSAAKSSKLIMALLKSP